MDNFRPEDYPDSEIEWDFADHLSRCRCGCVFETHTFGDGACIAGSATDAPCGCRAFELSNYSKDQIRRLEHATNAR
jgi:hypothetical protein